MALTLARLLSQRQWSLLDTLVTSTPKSEVLIDEPSLPNAVTSDIIVHFAVRFQAPLNIVSLLGDVYPHSLASADVTGRFPLHVACKWACTPDVVAYLLKTNPSSAGVPDSLGKVPLHYAAEFYRSHFNDPQYSRNDCMLQVVRLLKTAAPTTVNLEDNDGSNPIEYALISDAHIKIIKTMQRAARDDWRERSNNSTVKVISECSGDETPQAKQHTQNLQRMGRRRHCDLVQETKIMAKLQRDYSTRIGSKGESKMYSGDRIHIHKSTTMEANTQAARTA